MTDIATLGLRLDANGFIQGATQATKATNNLAVAGDRATVSTKKLSDGMSASERAVLDQLKAIEQNTRSLGQLGQTHVKVGHAAEEHAFATGKAIRALEGLSVEALGANHQMATLGVVMGEFAAGNIAVIAGLAAVAAAAGAYEILAEEGKKAKEEQEKLTKALSDWYDKLSEGRAGDFPKQIDAMKKKVIELREEVDKLNGGGVKGAVTAAGSIGLAGWLRVLTSGASGGAGQFAIEAAKSIGASTKAINDGTNAITAATEAAKINATVAALEVEKQRALATAFGATQGELEALGIEYDRQIANVKSANDARGTELGLIRRQNDETAALKTVTATFADTILRVREEDGAKGFVSITESLKNLQPVVVGTTSLVSALNDSLRMQEVKQSIKTVAPEIQKTVLAIGAANDKQTRDQTDEDAKRLHAAQKYQDDIAAIWRDGVGKITTDGFKSYHDFFEDVFQMFSSLMKRMQEEAERLNVDPGVLSKGLGLGAAAIGGGMSGYASGSASTGILSGALAGGSIAGPWGAAIGGLAGAAGALFGAAKAQQEAADAQRQAFESAYASLIQMNVQAGTSSARAGAVVAARTAADQLYDTINKALPGLANQIEREKELAQVRLDETAIVAKINEGYRLKEAMDQQGLQLQILQLQGRDDDARSLQHAIELEQALSDSRSAEYIALLKTKQALEDTIAATNKANAAFFAMADAAFQATLAARSAAFNASHPIDPTNNRDLFTNALQSVTQQFADAIGQQLGVLKDQLKVQEDAAKTADQAHSDTQRAIDSLTQLRSTLNVGPLSTLSPIQQVQAARAAVDDIYRQASAGDKSAAGNFGGAAQSYLSVLQGYGASGAFFNAGSNDIKSMADALIDKYGMQASVEQQALDAANAQVTLLQTQADFAQKQLDALSAAGTQLTAIYDAITGTTPGGVAGNVYNAIVGTALSQLLGGTPAGVSVGNPWDRSATGLPFGATDPTTANMAEVLYYAFARALNGPGIRIGTPDLEKKIDDVAAQLAAIRAVLADGFQQSVAATDRVSANVEGTTQAVQRTGTDG